MISQALFRYRYLTMATLIVSVMSNGPIVYTTSGPIRGLNTISNGTGKPLKEFRGIPFAQPPKRFKKPAPVKKWTDTLDATSFGAGCQQNVPDDFADFRPDKMSEDCLYLNVYVPQTKDKTLPVMVWIYGGGLIIGFSHQFDGSVVATSGNVIVVTINYRVDIFGFLSTGHPSSPGNYGLWDQKLALQWVHDNIASFGGNPDAVTIFGESAGGWSVTFQSLIPSNKGLFQRAIAQSGTVTDMCFTGKSSKQTNKRLIDTAKNTQCPVNDMFKFVNCLRHLEVNDLFSNSFDFAALPEDKYELLWLAHAVVVDGDLFKSDPFEDLKNPESDVSKFFRSLDFMTGFTSNENQEMTAYMMPKLQENFGFNVSDGIPAKFLCEGMIKPYVETFHDNNQGIRNKLCDFYTAEGSQDEQSMKAFDFMNDVWFRIPAARMLDHHSLSTGATYQYVFSKETNFHLTGTPPKYAKGTPHGAEIEYLFDMKVLLPSLNDSYSKMKDTDKSFSKTFINYFSSFARTGVPDGGEDAEPWQQYDPIERRYLDLDTTPSMKQKINFEAVKFWANEMPAGQKPMKEYLTHDEL